MFHHRLPTSTANVTNACHPFTTKDFFSKERGGSGTQYHLIHNGVISSYKVKELKEAHDKLGIKYTSMQSNGDFNDSEALMWDVALYLEGRKEKLDAVGSIAFICIALNPDTGDKLYFGTNRGDLNIELTDDSLFISSEGPGEAVKEHTLHVFDYKDYTLSSKHLLIPRYSTSTTTYTPPHTHATTAPTYTPSSATQDNDDNYRWDDETNTMLCKMSDGSWKTWDEAYESKSEPKTEAKNMDLSFLDMTDADEIEEIGRAYAEAQDADRAITINFSKASTVFIKAEPLKAKSTDLERQRDIQDKYKEYMEEFNGNYQEAYTAVFKDLECLREEFDDVWQAQGNVKDLRYEIRIWEGLADALTLIPDWVDTTSVDARYAKPKAIPPSTFSKAIEAEISRREEEDDEPITDEQIKDFRQLVSKMGGDK